MGRKKKAAQKRKDTRGYFQGTAQQQQQQPQSATKSVSSKAHDDIKSLIGQLEGGSDGGQGTALPTSSAPPSDRFFSRLSNVVDQLETLGFNDSYIEKVVVATKYEITIENALDWLCLNLNTMELPTLLTDGRLRDSLSTVTTSESLTVLKVAAPAATKDASGTHAKADNVLAVPNDKEEPATIDSAEERRQRKQREKEEQEEEERKKWLLKQYEFEEVQEPAEDIQHPQNEDKSMSVPSLSPEEQCLAEEEEKLQTLEADLKNEANNYMRSKQEIKQLQNQAKKLRQQVIGLRKKVERNKAKLVQQEENGVVESPNNVVSAKEDDQEEEVAYSGGIFDVFGDQKIEEPTPITQQDPSDSKKRSDFTIPKGWTGTTPQKKLDEVCKKQKLPKPKYTKLQRNEGFRLAASIKKKKPAQQWEAKATEFQSGSSLKDFLATQALYAIDSSVPLYQVFPPAFRDLWLSWSNQQKEEKDEAQKQLEITKHKRLDHLVSLISGQQVDQNTSSAIESHIPQHQTTDDHHEIFENEDWEDGVTDAVPSSSVATPSVEGMRMQKEFARRQTTQAYKNMKQVRESLPMKAYRRQVLEMVQRNPVTILCAETGAGKTTQCPQYILEQALMDGRGDSVHILCTQPRRVAAVSVAERVAEEMCDQLGKAVGYQIRMESRRSAETKLLFCTTGIILRRLQDDATLGGTSHVIVDEVHERQQQTDVLLVILRQLLRTTRPDLKVILMSATMDSSLFCSFFNNAPMISVPGRTFPVSNYYLEDLMDSTGHVIEEGSRYAKREKRYEEKSALWVTGRGGEKHREVVDLASQVELGEVSMYPGYKMSTRRSMERVNEEVVNYDLIEDVLMLLLSQESTTSLVAPEGADLSSGSVLIFLPGLGEIKSMTERLEGNRVFRDRQRFTVIPMHSTLSSRDQRRAFLPPQKGCRKIILSTNIAETSVTIPDVVCVIDSGRVREVRRNKRTSTSILATDWCSKASAKQRAGRAGRVQPGLCLKLYSSRTAEITMKAASEPELRRVPLEEVCLGILASGFAKSCIDFLNQAPQPPAIESVQAAIDVLYDVGAIKKRPSEGIATTHQFEQLTPLGLHLAKLPVDVRLGKMLIYGALFQCIDPILTIAASISSQSPFSTFVSDVAVAKAKQKAFADPDSDFATRVNVFEAYSKAAATSSNAGRKFCTSNYLNYVALREISDARRQFLDLLCGIGFLDRKVVFGNGKQLDLKSLQSCHFNRYASKPELVNAVICAGLYPHVARLDQVTANDYSLWHKDERLYFHSSSVNVSKKHFPSSDIWVVFHEKFGTPNRTSVSTTCFVNPIALLLFGGSVEVKHLHRTVLVDDWITIGMAAQIGVILKELRKKLETLLQKMIERADEKETEKVGSGVIEGIISILES